MKVHFGGKGKRKSDETEHISEYKMSCYGAVVLIIIHGIKMQDFCLFTFLYSIPDDVQLFARKGKGTQRLKDFLNSHLRQDFKVCVDGNMLWYV